MWPPGVFQKRAKESIAKMSSLEMELDNGEENLGDDILSLSTADEIQVSLT